MAVYHQDRPFPIPADPFLPRLTPPTAAQIEAELPQEGGIEQAARMLLKWYPFRADAIRVLHRWARETGELRWNAVADHIAAMPATAAEPTEYERYLAGPFDPRD